MRPQQETLAPREQVKILTDMLVVVVVIVVVVEIGESKNLTTLNICLHARQDYNIIILRACCP
jgi:hypothetical protein